MSLLVNFTLSTDKSPSLGQSCPFIETSLRLLNLFTHLVPVPVHPKRTGLLDLVVSLSTIWFQ